MAHEEQNNSSPSPGPAPGPNPPSGQPPQNTNSAISQALLSAIPSSLTVDFGNSVSQTKNIIEESNEKAKSAIIKAYAENETERVKRQKPLLWAIVVLTALQLLFFNGIIAAVVYRSFTDGQLEVIDKMFDILKYYIGATAVELIGMIVFITSGTFSTAHIKTMKMLFEKKKD